MTRALLVYPEFRSASFWNYRETCELVDARYPAAPLGLVTIAAMLPPDWEVKLVDRNIEEWNDSMLDETDVVLTGGMMPQQRDCIELIQKARAKGKPPPAPTSTRTRAISCWGRARSRCPSSLPT